jgi:predicted house-cleaning NTP pyrophosphatase (Maf/HAM1 superfamily)
MRKVVQIMPKSRDQSERKHTQHNMIEQTKSVCVCVCLAEKAKSSRPDVVHTRLDGMLSDKRST